MNGRIMRRAREGKSLRTLKPPTARGRASMIAAMAELDGVDDTGSMAGVKLKAPPIEVA